jgi:DNA-binding XRE family transcriptional regulator
MSCIYLATNVPEADRERHFPCKIGYTSYPAKRLSQFATANHNKVEFLWLQECDNPEYTEALLHIVFKERRIKHGKSTEWFQTNADEVSHYYEKYRKSSPELTLGEQIRLERKKLKWTQTQLSNYSGITQETISKVETGSTNTQVETLQYLGKALNLQLTFNRLPPRIALP